MYKYLLTLLTILFVFISATQLGALNISDFEGSVGMAALLSRTNDEINSLKFERKKLRKLIKQIGGRKKNKAENIESATDLLLADIQKQRKRLSKLQNKVLKEEAFGVLSKKTEKKFVRFGTRMLNLLGQANKTGNKISSFVVNNEVKTANFQGAWNTNFGRIVFAQFDDNFITGTYFYSGGGIARGTVDKRIFAGTYTGNNGETGTFVIKMAKNGKSWGGRYKSSDGKAGGPWRAEKA